MGTRIALICLLTVIKVTKNSWFLWQLAFFISNDAITLQMWILFAFFFNNTKYDWTLSFILWHGRNLFDLTTCCKFPIDTWQKLCLAKPYNVWFIYDHFGMMFADWVVLWYYVRTVVLTDMKVQTLICTKLEKRLTQFCPQYISSLACYISKNTCLSVVHS